MITDIGPHRVQHGDIANGVDALMAGESADLLYTDPPWGDGIIKMFATMNRKATGAINEPLTIDQLQGALADIAERYASRFMVIEYGVAWRDAVQAHATKSGTFVAYGIIDALYPGGRGPLPIDVHLFARRGEKMPSEALKRIVTGKHGPERVRSCVRALTPTVMLRNKAPILLDPCCGQGLMAKVAVGLGFRFRGNELNAARLEKTKAILRAAL